MKRTKPEFRSVMSINEDYNRKLKPRTCSECKKERRTASKAEPYICKDCLKEAGKKLMKDFGELAKNAWENEPKLRKRIEKLILKKARNTKRRTEMEKHVVICDRCGISEQMRDETNCYRQVFLLPEAWKRVEFGDLCPKCYGNWKDFIKKFRQGD